MKSSVVGVLLALSLLSPVSGFAQAYASPSSPEYDKGWFSMGVGEDNYGLSWFLSANFGREQFVQLGVTSSSSILGRSYYSAVNLGAGYSISDRIGRIATSTGPVFVWGEEHPDKDNGRYFRSVGLFSNLQINITPVKEMGLGLDLFGIITPQFGSRISSFISTGIRFTLVIEGHK